MPGILQFLTGVTAVQAHPIALLVRPEGVICLAFFKTGHLFLGLNDYSACYRG